MFRNGGLAALIWLFLVSSGAAEQARVLQLRVFPPEAEVRGFLPGSPPAGDVLPSQGEMAVPEGVLVLPVRIAAEGFESREEEIKLVAGLSEAPNLWRFETALRPNSALAALRTQWHFYRLRTSLVVGGLLLLVAVLLATFRKRLKAAEQRTLTLQAEAAAQVETLKQKILVGSSDLDGEVIDDYTVLKTLGEGAYSRVYQASHNVWGDLAAIKILKQETRDEELIARMKREVEIGRGLKHPNIVKLYGFGTFRGSPYMINEFVPGRPLDEVLERETITVSRACRIAEQIVDGLRHAHSKGVVHRDLKPGNLFLTPDDEVRILDFGLARLLESDQKLTKTGQALGTPLYMSPEQIRGTADRPSDFYSFGVIFFELLTGQPPFAGDRTMEVLSAHAFKKPPNIRELNPNVPEEIAVLVERLLIKRPEQRLADPDVILGILSKFKTGV